MLSSWPWSFSNSVLSRIKENPLDNGRCWPVFSAPSQVSRLHQQHMAQCAQQDAAPDDGLTFTDDSCSDSDTCLDDLVSLA